MTTYLQYAQRGRTSWWRYPVCVFVAVLGAIILGAIASAILQGLRFFPPGIAQLLSHPSNPPAFFGGTAAVMGFLFLAFVAAARLIHGKRFSDLIGTWRWKAFAVGFALWSCIQVANCVADLVLVPGGIRFTLNAETVNLVLIALPALAIQTFTEEILFRGYLTQALLLATEYSLAAALISALLFGAMHVPNGMPQAVSAAAFGFVCSLIAIRMAGIAFTAGLHLANNFFGAVVVVSQDDVFKGAPGLFTENTPHLMWWDVIFTVGALVTMLCLVNRQWAPKPAVGPPL